MSFIRSVMQKLQADELMKAEAAKKKPAPSKAPAKKTPPQSGQDMENGQTMNSSPNIPGEKPTPVESGKKPMMDPNSGKKAPGQSNDLGENKDLNGQPMKNDVSPQDDDMDPTMGDDQGDILHPVGEDENADDQILRGKNTPAGDEDSFAEPQTDQANLEYVKMSQHDGGKQFWYRDPATGKIIEGDNAPEGHADYDASGMLQSLIQRIEQLEQAVGVQSPDDSGMMQQAGQMGPDGQPMDQDDEMMDDEDGDMDDMFGDEDEDMDPMMDGDEEGQDQGMNDMDGQNSAQPPQGAKVGDDGALQAPSKAKPQYGDKKSAAPAPASKPAAKPNPTANKKQAIKKALKEKYPTASEDYLDKILEKSFQQLSKAGDNANNAQTGMDDTSSYGPGSEGMDESSIGQGGDMMKASDLVNQITHSGQAASYRSSMPPSSPHQAPTQKPGSFQNLASHQGAGFTPTQKSEENPDSKQDATLGEKVEKLVEQHMMENKEAEKKEGHPMFKAGEPLVKPMEPVVQGTNSSMQKSKSRFERMWMVSKVDMPEGLERPEDLKKAQEGIKKLHKFIMNQGKSESDATHTVNRAVIEKYDLLNKGSRYFENYNAWVGGETINTTYETTIENMEQLKKSDADHRFAVREYLEEREDLVIEKSRGSNEAVAAEMTHDAPVWKEYKEYKEPIVKSVDPRTIQRSEKYSDMWGIPEYKESNTPYRDSSPLVKSDINERIASDAIEKAKDSNNFKGRYTEFNESLEKSKSAPKTDAELRNEEADQRIWGIKNGDKK